MSLVLVGKISGVHGVKGAVRLRSFLETPRDIIENTDLVFLDGCGVPPRRFSHNHKEDLVCFFDDVTNRTQAEALKGKKIYIPREKMPTLADDNAYYHTDLIDMAVWANDQKIGHVLHVENYGAGDFLEIKGLNDERYTLPFQDFCIEQINQDNRIMTVNPNCLLGTSKKHEKSDA